MKMKSDRLSIEIFDIIILYKVSERDGCLNGKQLN